MDAETHRHILNLTFEQGVAGTIHNTAASNTKALEINWFVAAGSGYTSGTLSTSWASTVTANRAAGLTANLSANTANRFYLTGVQLEVGSFSSDFEFKSYSQELALCQRYYYKNSGAGIILFNEYNETTSNNWATVFLPVTMRSAPTATTTALQGGTVNSTDTSIDMISLNSTSTTAYIGNATTVEASAEL